MIVSGPTTVLDTPSEVSSNMDHPSLTVNDQLDGARVVADTVECSASVNTGVT